MREAMHISSRCAIVLTCTASSNIVPQLSKWVSKRLVGNPLSNCGPKALGNVSRFVVSFVHVEDETMTDDRFLTPVRKPRPVTDKTRTANLQIYR